MRQPTPSGSPYSRSDKIGGWGLVFAALGVLVTLAAWLFPINGHNDGSPGTSSSNEVSPASPTIVKVKVINVVGGLFDDAETNLKTQSLAVLRQDVDSAKRKGEVVAQDPEVNTEVNKGTTVILHVSKGNQIQMPDLIGKTLDEAIDKLHALGWNGRIYFGGISAERPDEVDKIVEQEIANGQAITSGQEIHLKVAVRKAGGG